MRRLGGISIQDGELIEPVAARLVAHVPETLEHRGDGDIEVIQGAFRAPDTRRPVPKVRCRGGHQVL